MRRKISETLVKLAVVCLMSTCVIVPKVHADEVSDLRQEKAAAQEEAKSLTEQIEKAIAEIDATEQELITLGENMIQVESEILEVEMDIKAQEKAMGKTDSTTIYNNGNKSVLETILDSGSMVDLIKKVMNVKTVEEKQQEQLDAYIANQEKLSLMKSKMKQDAAVMEEKQAELTKEKEELDKMLETTMTNVEELDTKIQEAAETKTAQEGKTGNTNTILTDDGEIISKSNRGAAIVAAARSQLGVPYVWGGTSPGKGLDCSGLVQYCYKTIGVSLPRTSSSQRSAGKKVDGIENALPGDIICYSGHVGIYIGNGQMIHAPQTGDVVKVSSVYRSKSILAIRRCW